MPVGRTGSRWTADDVDAARGDGGDQVVAEAVGADPADPAGAVPGAGERAGHVGLGAADGALERRGDVGEPRPGRPAGRKVTMDSPRQTTSTSGSVATACSRLVVRRGSSRRSPGGRDRLVDPALAGMLDSTERHTQ